MDEFSLLYMSRGGELVFISHKEKHQEKDKSSDFATLLNCTLFC